MKTIIFILSLIFNSCVVFYGPNYNTEKLVQKLNVGMTKQEAINIMGKDYIVESVSNVPEGRLEVLYYSSVSSESYLLYFVNGYLTEYHRYVPHNKMRQDIHIIKEETKR